MHSRSAIVLAACLAVLGAALLLQSQHAQANPGHEINTCHLTLIERGDLVVARDLSCSQAHRVLHVFFRKAQTHGVPLHVGVFRCYSTRDGPTVSCVHGSQRVDYYGSPG